MRCSCTGSTTCVLGMATCMQPCQFWLSSYVCPSGRQAGVTSPSVHRRPLGSMYAARRLAYITACTPCVATHLRPVSLFVRSGACASMGCMQGFLCSVSMCALVVTLVWLDCTYSQHGYMYAANFSFCFEMLMCVPGLHTLGWMGHLHLAVL